MRKLSIEKSNLEAKENLNMVEKNTLDNITKEIKKLKVFLNYFKESSVIIFFIFLSFVQISILYIFMQFTLSPSYSIGIIVICL